MHGNMSMFPISLKSLSDQERHDYILKTFILNKQANKESSRYKRDIDIIKEHHRFLWDEDEDSGADDSWEKRLAKRYYDKLFKEYCIVELTRYKENKVALRWRTEAEVITGKGQFQCGNRKCDLRDSLRSWEVNFAYQENGERKNALVKLRLCPPCSLKLNHTSQKREVKRLKRKEKHQEKQLKRSRRKETKTKTSKKAKKIELTNDATEASSDNESPQKEKTEPSESQVENTIESPSENIWAQKLELDTEATTREDDFERYLEDLLL